MDSSILFCESTYLKAFSAQNGVALSSKCILQLFFVGEKNEKEMAMVVAFIANSEAAPKTRPHSSTDHTSPLDS